MGNPVAWFEIVGRDGAKLRAFYSSVFDWTVDASDPAMDYGLVAPAGGGIGGGIGRSEDGGPGHVTVYVEVDDPTAYLAKVEQHGGTTTVPPMKVDGTNLTIAFFTDPEGHLVGLSNGVVS